MKTVIKENSWLTRDVSDFGWGNGYVLIPEGHTLHGKPYDDINEFVEIHSGLTFSELVTKEMIERWPELNSADEGGWLVGFDTCHYNDTLRRWPKEAVQMEADNLLEQLKSYPL